MEYTIAWERSGIRNETTLSNPWEFFELLCSSALNEVEPIEWVALVELNCGTIVRLFGKEDGVWTFKVYER